MPVTIYELMIIVFVINLPFGHLRSKSTKFSRRWIMAIHVPIPFVFVLRVLSGLNWTMIPLVVLADVAGQIVGGKLSDSRRKIVRYCWERVSHMTNR